MSNNVTSIEGRKPLEARVREGRKARVAAMTKGTVSYLNKFDAQMTEAGEHNERVKQCRDRIDLAIRFVYARLEPEEAAQIVSEAHEEVRKSKGVQS